MSQNNLRAIGLFHFTSHFRILYLSVYLDKLKKVIPPSTSNALKFPSWEITKTARRTTHHRHVQVSQGWVVGREGDYE